MINIAHTIVLDAGPIIRNEPALSTLLKQAERIVTVPVVVAEIKDAAARARISTTLLPFLSLQTPNPNSIKLVKEFARRTGDLSSLSNPDLQIIALAYETECERNGGDWRLRSTPGQKRTNGPSPKKATIQEIEVSNSSRLTQDEETQGESLKTDQIKSKLEFHGSSDRSESTSAKENRDEAPSRKENQSQVDVIAEDMSSSSREPEIDEQELISRSIATMAIRNDGRKTIMQEPTDPLNDLHESDSDPESWITPFNIRFRKHESNTKLISHSEDDRSVQVATITTDYAMQNVLLQMNLNLLSTSLQRIRHLKNFVLRCHACFHVEKDMGKQFCPRCGKPAFTKVSCSTSQDGGFRLHLKKNMQWNTKGDRYSIPKPVPGSANGKTGKGGKGKGGGKGGWGQDLILAEDQKEYSRAVVDEKRKERSLMDDDFLPSILTGERRRPGGRPKIGAGRNVNSRKR